MTTVGILNKTDQLIRLKRASEEQVHTKGAYNTGLQGEALITTEVTGAFNPNLYVHDGGHYKLIARGDNIEPTEFAYFIS